MPDSQFCTNKSFSFKSFVQANARKGINLSFDLKAKVSIFLKTFKQVHIYCQLKLGDLEKIHNDNNTKTSYKKQ